MSARMFAGRQVAAIILLFPAGAVAQSVSIAPATLGFGNVAVGSTLAKKVTVTNGQSVTLIFSAPAITGNSDFTIVPGGSCGAKLAAGASCSYHISFTPTAMASESATFSANDNASNSPQQVALRGTGTVAASVSPTSLGFGTQLVTTTSAAKTVTLTNNESAAIALNAPAISGNFALAGGTCGSSLAAFSKCTYLVTFTPPTIGTLSGSLTINAQVANGPFTIALSGTGGTVGIQSVTLNPPSATLANGGQQQFTATANLNGGGTMDVSGLMHWSSSNTRLAKVTASGLATAIGGTATIKGALTSTLYGTATVSSPPVLVSIALRPLSSSLPVGITRQFTATGTYNDGSTQDLTGTATWGSSAPNIAGMAAGGLVTGNALGKTTISATLGTVTGSTGLTVTAAIVTSLTIAPSNFSIPTGGLLQLSAIGMYSDGSSRQVTSSATWQSSDTTVASVAPGGIATGVAAGSVNIGATVGAATTSTQLTVTAAVLQAISISPMNSAMMEGDQQPFTATGLYTDGSTVDLTTAATWNSTDNAAARVNNNGVVMAANPGWTTMSATYQGASGATVVSVSEPGVTLQSITVSPNSASMAVGDMQSLSATANFSDGSSRDVTSAATWYVNQVNARYPVQPLFAQYAMPSPALTGALVELDWAMVDMGPGATGGQYQWANFDATYVAPIVAMGKKVNLAVWAQNYPGQPSSTPAYAQQFSTNVVPGCTAYPTWVAPPYSPDFVAAYKNFLAQVVQHYANNPSIGYIRVGMSSGGEIYRYCAATLEGYAAPAAYSGAPYNCDTSSVVGQCVWLAYDNDILQFVQSQAPAVQILGPSTSQNQGGADPGFVYPSTEDDQAAAAGFGFGNQGLQISDINNYAKGLPCNADWCAKFDEYTGLVPLELQTAQPSDPTCTGVESSCTNITGSLVDLLPFADAHYTTIFEIYESDVYVGVNPFDPNYTLYGAQYANAFQNAMQNNGMVTVTPGGTVAAVTLGTTTVYAQYGAISGSAVVTVTAPSTKKPAAAVRPQRR